MFGKKKEKKTPSDDKNLRRERSKNIGKRIKGIFGIREKVDENVMEELEDLLVEADFGSSMAVDVVNRLRIALQSSSMNRERSDILEKLKDILRPSLISCDITPVPGKLSVYLILGVNGVGKTTTIAKMARRFQPSEGMVFAAGDTYRAAAVEQLTILAERAGARLVSQKTGSDPGSVIYDAVNSAQSRGERVVFADTSGRLHNKANLMKELEKIDRIASERTGGDGVYRKILVIDATTGQNGLQQAETFHEAVGIDAVVMAKYDSSAKGGLAVAISHKLKIPFAFLGRGEGLEDLIPFDPESYLDELLSLE